ncbi:hypothetical protein [Streptomyces sioyaensis]|uniref:hypothetical protein n=1 Tax=Streptomyces sioyaensis TaxID=67364 RepID=UPI0036EEA3D3
MQATGVRPGARPAAVPGNQLRAVRAALFTALCTTLSAASHVLLSRAPLPPVPVLAIAAAVFVAAYLPAGRERGYGAFAALLVPLELAADTVFTTGQHACYGRAGGPVAGPLHSVGVDLLCRGGELGTPLARVAAPSGTALPTAAPWLLLAVHVTAGLLAATWLHRGDAALDALLRAAAAGAFRPLRTAAAVATAAGAPLRRRIRPLHPLPPSHPLPLLSNCVRRRGPPSRAAA